MKFSSNYNLNLPDLDDKADIRKLNENFEKIDETMKSLETDPELAANVVDIKNKIGTESDADTQPTLFGRIAKVLKAVLGIDTKIGETDDSVGSNKDGSMMGKLNTLYSLLMGGVAVFDTVGEHEFTVPAGITKIRVTAAASGGGSGASLVLWSSYSSLHRNLIKGGGGGGSGQSINQKEYSVTPGQKIKITIGAPGLSASPIVEDATDNRRKVSDGSNAEPTIIGELITLVGGKAGTGADCSGTGYDNEETQAPGGVSAGIGSTKGNNGGYAYVGSNGVQNYGGGTGVGGSPSIGGAAGKGADAGKARNLTSKPESKEAAMEFLQNSAQKQGNVGMVKIEWGVE